MVSYDVIYQYFINNITIDSLFLPATITLQKEAIKNAVILYNNRMQDTLTCDDTLEVVDQALTDNQILLIANFIKLVLLKNVHTYKSSILYTFTKEIGVKDVQAQLKAAQYDIESQENSINMLIFNADDSTIMWGD